MTENTQKNQLAKFQLDVLKRFERDPDWFAKELSFTRWIFRYWLPAFFHKSHWKWNAVIVVASLLFGGAFNCSPTVRELTASFQKESAWIFGTLVVGIILVAIPNAFQQATEERSFSKYTFHTVQALVYHPIAVFGLSAIIGSAWMFSGTRLARKWACNQPFLMGAVAAALTLFAVFEVWSMLKHRADMLLSSAVEDVQNAAIRAATRVGDEAHRIAEPACPAEDES